MKTGPKPRDPLERFREKYVEQPDGCWLWAGMTNGRYSRFYTGEGRHVPSQYAHRWSYEHFVGPIPDGYEIDHLCARPLCVNPAHLEPVTPAENKRRHGLRRTHCPTGHPYDYFNTRIFNGYALCMTCDREAHRRTSR